MGDLQKRFVSFITQKSTTTGQFSFVDLKKSFPNDEHKKLVPFLNTLLSSRKLQLFKNPDKSIFYKILSNEETEKFQGLTKDHELVLQEIKLSGSKGIWVRTIKARTRLANVTISKVLLHLEKKQLIKAVQSITAKKQKLYMLFDVVPDKEHTGGVWFTSSGEFDTEFVSHMSRWVKTVIKQNGSHSIEELTDMLKKSKLTNVVLSKEDMKCVVDKLRYEDEIEEFIDPLSKAIDFDNAEDEAIEEEYFLNKYNPDREYKKRWKVVNKIDPMNFLSEVPCGVCPVSHQCSIDGKISPKTCVYMDKWLGSDDLKF